MIPGQVLLGRRPDPQAQPVVGEDIELVEHCPQVRGPGPYSAASTECVPERVVPIIPPSVAWSCVAGSGPNVSRCGSAASLSSSQNHARLHPRLTASRVQLHDGVHVPREVEDDGLVDGSGPPGRYRSRGPAPELRAPGSMRGPPPRPQRLWAPRLRWEPAGRPTRRTRKAPWPARRRPPHPLPPAPSPWPVLTRTRVAAGYAPRQRAGRPAVHLLRGWSSRHLPGHARQKRRNTIVPYRTGGRFKP